MQQTKSQPTIYREAQNIWQAITSAPRLKDFVIEIDFYRKLLQVFCVGNFYHFIFNIRRMNFDFISPEMPNVLGYAPEKITTPFFLSLIHPEDLPYYMLFEKQVVNFFNPMEKEQVMNYKVRYDYRVKRADGTYIRILHQMLTIIPDANGVFVNTFCVHTDITYLKNHGIPMLSFIGLQGEPSYVDVGGKPVFLPSTETLTLREKEIVMLLAKGYSSKQIGAELFISTATVSTHRKNILRKTCSVSTPELVANSITKGWL